jgi:hypothetical protein
MPATYRERGFALVAVMVVMTLLLSVGAAMHVGVMGDTTLRGAHARASAGFYAAEGGINRGIGEYRNIFVNWGIPSGSDFDPRTFTIGPRTVTYQLAPVGVNPRQVVVPAGHQFAGLNAIEYRYTANATSEILSGDTEVSLGSEFWVDYVPLFQFLAFYADDLEILPGPNMTVTGPIHTNGSLYLNTNSASTFTVQDSPPQVLTVSVTAAGDVYRGRKDAPGTCAGTVRIAKLADGDMSGSLDLQNLNCPWGAQPAATLATWLGAIKSNIPAITVPTPDVIARGTGEFWQKADLRLALDLTAEDGQGRYPIVVEDINGNVDAAKNALLQTFMTARPGRIFYNDVPEPGKDLAIDCTSNSSYCKADSYDPDYGAGLGAGNEVQLYACPQSDDGLYACGAAGPANYVSNTPLTSGGVTARRGGFYNNREGQWVYMLNVNVHDLLWWNLAQPAGSQIVNPADASDGGLVIFLSVKSVGGCLASPRYGARVFGTTHLDFPGGLTDPTGVTVVSDVGLYVEGNYNTGIAGAPKQPAALIGDTINVLSNNWSGPGGTRNDYQSRQPLASRPATSTTVNSAFLGGTDLTAVGAYNGGLENYPRFHETWSGQTLTYRGSFVSLGQPQCNNGAWCGTGGGCNIYNPPVRNWNYDTEFQQAQNLPPLTPRVVSVQQILFTENFR